MEVDEDSQQLLTINNHKGVFKYKRLLPIVKSAFQKVIDNMIEVLEETERVIGNEIVFEKKTQAENDRNKNNALQKIRHLRSLGTSLRHYKVSPGSWDARLF